MPVLPPSPQISVLPWQQPLPEQVAAWLIEQAGWAGDAPLDLGHWLILVPTRQSGRRLREALAVAAAARAQAVFAPRVVVPEALPAEVARRPDPASREQVLVAWMRVLLAARPAAYRAVFPVDPPRRDEAWARGLAGRLQRVQQELAAGGLRMADVLRVEDLPETKRWEELAQLEAQFDEALASQNVVSPVEANAVGLASVQPPPGVTAVVLAGCPDPNPVALRYLEALAPSVAIHVLVFGPEDPAVHQVFDGWGKPRPEGWTERALPLPDFYRQVELAADPSQQAIKVAERALAEPHPDEWLALAIVDPEVTAPLARELAEQGHQVFLPEGEPWRQGPLYGLLQALANLVESSDCRAVGNLLRCPDVMDALSAQLSGGIAASTLLRHWDRLLENHLVADLTEALAHAGTYPQLRQGLLLVAGWIERLRGEAFGEVAIRLPAEILGERQEAGDGIVAQGAQRWVDVVSRVEKAGAMLPGLSAAESWRLALEGFAEGTRFGPRIAGAIELGGWLEVLWADAPRLILAGANEGRLPESVSGDAFLPEALRERLGLKTNAQRLAVDAYLMAAAVACRPDPDDVLILVGKTAASGDPLRPSRVLLAGDDATLARRVEHLFRPLRTAVDNLPWRRAWKLRPRRTVPPSRLSVTGLRDWLECPFRFYLSRGLKMQAVELPKTELNAMDFGTLVHGVLEEMGRDPLLRETRDVGELQAGMLADLERRIERTYGGQPALPLLIQFESARQRLRRVAALEIEQRLEGWRTERVEWEFTVPLGELTVRGKIDRIDRHEDGRIRVIDYKTSDEAADPLAKHLALWREADADRPDWLQVTHQGKARRWVDLQLPLYRWAATAEFGRELTCAYFNLPKAISETGIVDWVDADGALQAAAEACAHGVAAAILAGEFWPPVEQLSRHDDAWRTLFHHGLAASVDEKWIQQEVVGE